MTDRSGITSDPDNSGCRMTRRLIFMLLATLAATSAVANDTAMFRVPDRDAGTRALLSRTFGHAHHDRVTGEWVIEADAAQVMLLEKANLAPKYDMILTARMQASMQGLTKTIPGFACYRTVLETNALIDSLVAAHPALATSIDIGDSWRKGLPTGAEPGFDLRLIKITNSAIAGDKPKMFVLTGLHAREYTPVEVSTKFAEWLLGNYLTDATARWLVDHNEFHLLFQANPDGRIIAENGSSQRKNRRDHASCTGTSDGVDLNRNFIIDFGGSASSGSLCNDIYRGTAALSEPETTAINNYIASIFPDTRPGANTNFTQAASVDTRGLYLDVHSFSEVVIWPWGFPGIGAAPNSTALQTLGRRLAFHNSYLPEQSNTSLQASGASDDHAYGTLGVPAYTFELGSQFFQDCTTFTNTILPRNLEAFRYGARILSRPYVMPSGPDSRNISLSATSVTGGTNVTVQAVIDDTRFNQSNGTESTQAITSANLYIDQLPWALGAIPQPMSALDGTFNATSETVTTVLSTTGLTPGEHMIFVQGTDASGIAGPPVAAFLTITGPANEMFSDGFE